MQGGARTGPVRLRLGFGGGELSHASELGHPAETGSAFRLDSVDQARVDLGRLILAAAARTQVRVVAHTPRLLEALSGHDDERVLALDRELGATRLPGQKALERAAWSGPPGAGHLALACRRRPSLRSWPVLSFSLERSLLCRDRQRPPQRPLRQGR